MDAEVSSALDAVLDEQRVDREHEGHRANHDLCNESNSRGASPPPLNHDLHAIDARQSRGSV